MKRLLPHIALALVVAQVLLMLLSWLYSAANPMSGVRPLLSSEGLRWFLGRFADQLATPVLVWLLLLSMAWGCLRGSGLIAHLPFVASGSTSYRDRRALMLSLFLLIIYIGVILLLTVVPHAVLLSASGRLWPSPFSASLVPVVALGGVMLGVVYGVVAGRFETLSSVYDSLLAGIRSGATCFFFYVLLTQFYESLGYVLP